MITGQPDDPYFLNWLSSIPGIRHLQAQSGSTILDYYIYGQKPRLFISSGMHGNEYQIISSISKALKDNLAQLPAFIYLPLASPSALAQNTRKNSLGQDVNRGFTSASQTDDSKTIMQIISQNHFDLSLSFHEDLDYSDFYMYDNLGYSQNKDISQNYLDFQKQLSLLGVNLFNGIDDPIDPVLNFQFENGYRAIKPEEEKADNGQLEPWLIQHHLSSRCFSPEIPSQLNQEAKDQLVQQFFDTLIIPFLKGYR